MTQNERLLTGIRQLREEDLSFGKIAEGLKAEGFSSERGVSFSRFFCLCHFLTSCRTFLVDTVVLPAKKEI
jgi:hypothetical protein